MLEPAGDGADGERAGLASSGPPVADAPQASEHSYEFRPSDEIDFVDQLDDDEPEHRDPPADDPPPEVRSP